MVWKRKSRRAVEMRDYNSIKIAVAGTGYVGLSLAVLLSQNHEVVAVDIIEEKVERLIRESLLFRMNI